MTPSLIPLSRTAGIGLLVLFCTVNTVNTVVTLGDVASSALAVLTLVLLSAGAVIVMLPAADPLPWGRTLAVAVLAVAVCAMAWNLPATGWPGWASWFWGARTFVLMALLIRQRIVTAWIAFALGMALTLVWSVSVGRSVWEGVGFDIRHAGLLFCVTLLVGLLRQSARSITELNAVLLERERRHAREDAAAQVRTTRLARLRALVADALTRLAGTAPLTESDRTDFRLREATIRDWLRGGALATDALIRAARTARERGVDIAILDDTPPETILHPDPAARIADLVAGTAHGAIVVRRRLGEDGPHTSVRIDERGRIRRENIPG